MPTTRTYCPACGHLYRTELGHCPDCPSPPASAAPARCPRCWRPLLARAVRGVTVDACARCRGVWFDSNEIQRAMDLTVIAAPSPAPATSPPAPTAGAIDPTLQVGCARCHLPMARVEAAPESRVWMHACREHGLWFDGPELPAFRAFVSRGGLRRVRATTDRPSSVRGSPPSSTTSDVVDAVTIAVDLLIWVWP